MRTPEKFKKYNCEEYFSSFIDGFYCELQQLWVISPLDEIEENIEVNFLSIGRSGWGGIDFGYRIEEKGLWVYYPIEKEFLLVAEDIPKLVEGWQSGRIAI